MIKILCNFKKSSERWICPEDLVSYWPVTPRHRLDTHTWITDIKTWDGASRYFRVVNVEDDSAAGYYLILASHVDSFVKFEGLACSPMVLWQYVNNNQLDVLLVFVHETFGNHDIAQVAANLYVLLDGLGLQRQNSITVVLGTKFQTIPADPKGRVRWVFYPWYAGIAQQQARTKLPHGRATIPETWQKPFTYVSFDANQHPHKDVLLKMLEYHDLLKHGVLTRNKTQLALSDWPETYTQSQQQHQEFFQWLSNNPNLPLDHCIDCKDTVTGIKQHWVGTKLLYDRANWEIVNESLCKHPGTFLSINTFRSMLMGMPFVINGCAGSLSLLRELGFKTFGDVIDESYDTHEDPIHRISCLVHQIQNLCRMDQNEKNTMWAKLRPILQHNQDLAWNQSHLRPFHDLIVAP